MSRINLPINQVKLTNVAVVRYTNAGKRFEIACYRNKVMDYRSGLETDLSEVLQTDRIFTNVSKGQFAKASDLQDVFGTKDEEEIAKIILERGNSVQVSDLERQQLYENTLSQVATWISNNCVHPDSGRPYTVSQIKHALGKSYPVQPHKAIKKQYLDAVKFLKTVIPIERAKMELSIRYPTVREEQVQVALARLVSETSQPKAASDGEMASVTIQVDPSLYRELSELAKSVDGASLEIVQQVVAQEGDVDLEQELERKQRQVESQQTVSKEIEDDDASDLDDEDAAPLKEKLEQVRLAAEHGDDRDTSHNDKETDEPQSQVSRKAQRKAQKKSKKANRREREEAAEKEARLAEERKRQEERENSVSEVALANAQQQEQQTSSSTKSCNTCGGSFPNAADYRAHFRSDWHRFNQKLKLKGVAPVSEEEFILCDAETLFGSESL